MPTILPSIRATDELFGFDRHWDRPKKFIRKVSLIGSLLSSSKHLLLLRFSIISASFTLQIGMVLGNIILKVFKILCNLAVKRAAKCSRSKHFSNFPPTLIYIHVFFTRNSLKIIKITSIVENKTEMITTAATANRERQLFLFVFFLSCFLFVLFFFGANEAPNNKFYCFCCFIIVIARQHTLNVVARRDVAASTMRLFSLHCLMLQSVFSFMQ